MTVVRLADHMDEVRQLYEEGLTIQTIANHFGVAHETVRRALIAQGISLRLTRRGQIATDTRERILALWTAGERSEDIVKQTGVPWALMKRLLAKDFGINVARETRLGHRNHRWQGGTRINNYGYRCIWADPHHPLYDSMAVGRTSASVGEFLEHRLIMAEALGRPLESHEQVHHINGDRTDNRLENLELRSTAHGSGVRHECCDCGSHNIRSVPIGGLAA